MSDFKINTKCLVGGYKPGNGEPRQIPIIQSTTFKYDTSEAMGKLFDLEATGYFYSRLQNPTCDFVAAKIAELEGGAAATYPSRVFKGNEGPGRMGRDTVTVQNVVLVKVIEDRNLMLVKGAVPGNKGGLVRVQYAVKGQDK